ncbi:SGNH/GDSL hydrolase family protein [Conexibacter sp. DBS9H8]|uniref:SGNH/GDSL hydrolase family protein n=1 Tax=Conexibacter sp. DBS9H8 TaxID=2937801 RepID=UPI00200DDD06|nr:SGNH/GDSL hydrolase family protein [Conexibacter sp. DBS9H8]
MAQRGSARRHRIPRRAARGVPIATAAAVALTFVLILAGGNGVSPALYLALGDSLAVGVQPGVGGQEIETPAGYTDQLERRFRAQVPGIRRVALGCPGETTTSLLTGAGDTATARIYHCDRTGGSQLAAALAVIHRDPAAVRVITIDIGANDLFGCVAAATIVRGLRAVSACLGQGLRAVSVNLPRILGALRSAGPQVPIAAMTIYDPFLIGLRSRNPTLAAIARLSLAAISRLNEGIAAIDGRNGVRTANVAARFGGSGLRLGRADPERGARRAVAALCVDTHVCATTPNVHPTALGYRRIAAAFLAVLPRLSDGRH